MQASQDPTGVLLRIVYSLLVAFLYVPCIREDKQRLVESQCIFVETLTDMIWFTFHGRSSTSVSMKPFHFVLYICEKIIDYLELPYAFYKENGGHPRTSFVRYRTCFCYLFTRKSVYTVFDATFFYIFSWRI